MAEAKEKTGNAWAERIQALRNVPPVLKILWESGPTVVTWGLILRVVVPLVQLATAAVAAHILNGVALALNHKPVFAHFWYWVLGEVVLALLVGILGRAIDYGDQLLADRYTYHVSVQVMEQAARLDLTTYEDPVFYDRLERARVQATDRLALIQQMGRLFQQIILTVQWSVILVYRSPFLILLLIAGVLPAFFGETHFAFLGYAKNFRQTPAKRQMDYLRQVGGSKEAAKELKLFNLSRYLTDRFPFALKEDLRRGRRAFAAQAGVGRLALVDQHARLLRRLRVCRVFRRVGAVCVDRYFLAHYCRHSAGAVELPAGVLDRVRHGRPGAVSHRPDRVFRDEAHGGIAGEWPQNTQSNPARIRVSQCFVCLPRHRAARAEGLQLYAQPGRADRVDRRERPGKDDGRQAHYPAL